jgi:hypothetical protein
VQPGSDDRRAVGAGRRRGNGQTDLADAAIVGTPAAQLGALSVAGGVVSFTPTSTGVFTFSYRAKDRSGTLSANTGTVTVTVSGAEQIAGTATFRTDKRRWIVTGTDSVIAGQTLTITYTNGTLQNGASAAGTVIGRAVVDAAGNWLLDLVGASGVLDPTNTSVFRSLPTSVRVTSPLNGSATLGISVRR